MTMKPMTMPEKEWDEMAAKVQAKIEEQANGFAAMTLNTVVHTGMFMFKKKVYRYTASIDLTKCLERAAQNGVLDLDEPKALGRATTELTFVKVY